MKPLTSKIYLIRACIIDNINHLSTTVPVRVRAKRSALNSIHNYSRLEFFNDIKKNGGVAMYCLILEVDGSDRVEETILILSSIEVPNFYETKKDNFEWTIFFAI